MHPVLTLPGDPIAVAEVTASMIRADRRLGMAVPLPSGMRFIEDSTRTGNLLASPAETVARGGGQCFDLSRCAGGFLGTHVGCLRSPQGFHVFLAFIAPDAVEPIVHDVAALLGAEAPPDYAGAAYVPIWETGPNGTRGPEGHDKPPAAGDERAYTQAVGSEVLARSGPTLSAVQAALEAEIAKVADPRRCGALEALCAVAFVGASNAPELAALERALASGVSDPTIQKLQGALMALAPLPSAEQPPAVRLFLGTRAPMRPVGSFTMTAPAPLSLPAPPPIRPRGSCPGSCAVK